MQRIVLVIGILCLLAGGLVAAGVVDFADERSVLSVGDAELSVETRETAPPTLGYGLLAVGALLTVGALVVRKR